MQRDSPGNPDQTAPDPWDEPQAQGLTAICVNELIKKEIPVREEWLSPWLRAQDLVMVHAPRGGSKTFFVLSVGLAVASGCGVLGWSAATPRRVLLVDGEMPAKTMQERSHGLIMANGLEPQPGYLKIITPDLQGQSMPDLSTLEGQALIEQHLVGPSLLILDNLSTLCRSGVENEAESWLPVQEWLLSLRRGGHSVVFVHHSGKSGLQRGTSRREDTLDVIIGLRRPSNYMAQDGARFEVHFEKARGLYGDVIRPLEAQLHSGTHGTMTWTYKTVEEGTVERVAKLLEEGLTQRAIAIELGISIGKANALARRARTP